MHISCAKHKGAIEAADCVAFSQMGLGFFPPCESPSEL